MSDRHQTTPYPLRMPEELRDQLKQAAAENHRSMNAEIVAGLAESFSADVPTQELIPADKARDISAKARKSVANVVRSRILTGLNQAVSMGHGVTDIDLRDLEMDNLPNADLDALIESFSEWLEEAGYIIEWDGADSVFIRFDDF
ncbi:MAG: DNA-binding protein [Halomonadaceae bacterium]|nr:DNA-binding protein [Halomonadaceae bacterium]